MVEFVSKEPMAKALFHPYYGATEFIKNKPRYCLWLGDCSPAELASMPLCQQRIKAVKEYREKVHLQVLESMPTNRPGFMWRTCRVRNIY